MRSVDELLSILTNVKKKSEREWQASCPAHDDKKPSLSISLTEDRKILLHCHAGCPAENIVSAMGLKMQDLFLDGSKEAKPTKSPGAKLVATYDYTDEAGNLLYQVLRFEPKDFRQRRPDGKGGWINNLDGVKRVPYQLPRILQALEAKPVFIVEGEKDVHTLKDLGAGFTATTCAGGANGWRDEFKEYFKGRYVAIIPDNDEPGRKFAETVAKSIHKVAKSVKVVHIPGLPDKGDITDWVNQGHTYDDLMELCDNTPEYEPSPDVVADVVAEVNRLHGAAIDGFPLTDLGNAERFIAEHGDNIKYHVKMGEWLIWDGRRWCPDEVGKIWQLMESTVRRMYDLLPETTSEHARDDLYKFIKRSEQRERLNAALELAKTLPDVAVLPEDLDADPELFNCWNGTVDLRTGEFREHRKSDLITKISKVNYDPKAKAARWDRFLGEVFAGNQELINFVQRAIGTCLTGIAKDRALFILYGKGANGKSVFLNTITALLGDYAKDTSINTFLETRPKDATNDLARLEGARFVTASEAEDGSAFHEALIKKTTGEDSITCRFLYKEEFTYKPTFKVFIATNDIPRIKSMSYAMKDRIKIVPFKVRFYAKEEEKVPIRDENLTEKLTAELPGILNWAIEGYNQWKTDRLNTPKVVRDEVEAVFESMDVLGGFLEECCILHPKYSIPTSELWSRYLEYCAENGIRAPAFKDIRGFARNLTKRDGIEAELKRVNNIPQRVLCGIGLRDAYDDDSPHGITSPDSETSEDENTDGRNVCNVKTAFLGKSLHEEKVKQFPKKPQKTLQTLRERETELENELENTIRTDTDRFSVNPIGISVSREFTENVSACVRHDNSEIETDDLNPTDDDPFSPDNPDDNNLVSKFSTAKLDSTYPETLTITDGEKPLDAYLRARPKQVEPRRCLRCGGNGFRWERMAYSGNGDWICTNCGYTYFRALLEKRPEVG